MRVFLLSRMLTAAAVTASWPALSGRSFNAYSGCNSQNPFGDAKPREAILASRTGKSETDIVKEEVKSEKPKVLLYPNSASSGIPCPSEAGHMYHLIEY